MFDTLYRWKDMYVAILIYPHYLIFGMTLLWRLWKIFCSTNLCICDIPQTV